MGNAGRAGGSRSAAIIAMLLLTFALTTAITWEAIDAARGHRDAADAALHDYAGFAAFLYRHVGGNALQRAVGPVLYGFDQIPPTAPLPSRARLDSAQAYARGMCTACPRVDSVRGYFRLDLRDGTIATDGAPVSAAARAWLADTIGAFARHGPTGDAAMEWEILIPPPGVASSAFVFVLRRDAAGRPLAAYGFQADPRDIVGGAYRVIFGTQIVLPASLTHGLPHDSLLALTVRDRWGRVLFKSPRRFGEATAIGREVISPVMGSLRIEVALRPESARVLLIGGMPRRRLPLLLLLMALSAGMTLVALVQLRRERELARLRADFVSGVSHELRTPLAQIRMFAETLRLGRVRSAGERVRSIEIIDQEARRLSGLVENVLLFSRAERRAVRIDRRPRELGSIVHDAVETFAPLALARKMAVHERADGRVWASVDSGAIRQVLLNLLDNAVKYGPAGQVIEVALSRADGVARIAVQDQGPGIPQRERGRIFAPFVRLKRDADSAVAGSGIGLSVVAQLVALHGGRVTVEDSPGGGARFVLELPAVDAEETDWAPAAEDVA
jgi:signal transduction histidine kinase